jgi:hypothetical protein
MALDAVTAGLIGAGIGITSGPITQLVAHLTASSREKHARHRQESRAQALFRGIVSAFNDATSGTDVDSEEDALAALRGISDAGRPLRDALAQTSVVLDLQSEQISAVYALAGKAYGVELVVKYVPVKFTKEMVDEMIGQLVTSCDSALKTFPAKTAKSE